jgi:hypothetical protein
MKMLLCRVQGPTEGMEDALGIHFFKLVLQHQHVCVVFLLDESICVATAKVPDLNEGAIEETVRQVVAGVSFR